MSSSTYERWGPPTLLILPSFMVIPFSTILSKYFFVQMGPRWCSLRLFIPSSTPYFKRYKAKRPKELW